MCVGLFAQAVAADSKLTFANKTISARFDAVPLTSVLDLIQSKMGTTYSLAPEAARPKVTVSFDSLPYDAAFGRILKEVNYSLVFNALGAVEHIHIFGIADRTASTPPGPIGTRVPENQLPGDTSSPFLPPREEMVIVKPDPSDVMPYIPPKEEMVIVKPAPGDGMPYIPPREKMVITRPDPSDGMPDIPPKETIQTVGRQQSD